MFMVVVCTDCQEDKLRGVCLVISTREPSAARNAVEKASDWWDWCNRFRGNERQERTMGEDNGATQRKAEGRPRRKGGVNEEPDQRSVGWISFMKGFRDKG